MKFNLTLHFNLISSLKNTKAFSIFSPFHQHGYCTHVAMRILGGCGQIPTRFGRMKSPMAMCTRAQTHTLSHRHKHTRCRKHRNTGVRHSPQHALTHWLADFVMGLSLTHWLRYVTTRETAPPPPSLLPPSLPAPPCIYAVFSREALAHLPPSSSSTTSAPSYSGGWQWGWGANEKGQDEDVWRAQGDDLTQFVWNVDVINVVMCGVFFIFVFTCLQLLFLFHNPRQFGWGLFVFDTTFSSCFWLTQLSLSAAIAP